MPRPKGSKNKNVNTAKNKNIININVNSSKSKRGRPRKTTANTNAQTRYPNYGGGNANAPQQVIISQPQADNNSSNNSLLSSFITSKMLNETMSLNRSNMTNVEPSRTEQPSYFNARESIIPKLPDTPKTTQPERIIKPSPKIETKKLPISIESPKIEVRPADVAPPKIDKVSQFSSSILDDAMNEIEKEDKASTLIGSAFRGHKGRSDYNYIKEYPKIAAKRLEEIKKMTPNDDITRKTTKREDKPTNVETQKEKNKKKFDEVSSQNPIRHDLKNVRQSTTDFLNMSFTPPKRDIVEMMTPSKDTTLTVAPPKVNKSLLDFTIGGSPEKTPHQLKTEKRISRLKEIKKDVSKPKKLFEYNDLKTELTGQPNPNQKIASGIIQRIAKSKLAQNDLVNKKIDEIKERKKREDAFEQIKAFSKRKLTKQYVEAKKELKPNDTREPLVVNQNTKQLILKKNRDRGIKAQKTAASKKRSAEQEKIINFSRFMLTQNGVNPYSGLSQTNI